MPLGTGSTLRAGAAMAPGAWWLGPGLRVAGLRLSAAGAGPVSRAGGVSGGPGRASSRGRWAQPAPRVSAGSGARGQEERPWGLPAPR